MLERAGADPMAPAGSHAWTLAQIAASIGQLSSALTLTPDQIVILRAGLIALRNNPSKPPAVDASISRLDDALRAEFFRQTGIPTTIAEAQEVARG